MSRISSLIRRLMKESRKLKVKQKKAEEKIKNKQRIAWSRLNSQPEAEGLPNQR